ncbi:MAG: hypothetical protein ACHQQS_10700 [Thermoanaerobaculales bacterium]
MDIGLLIALALALPPQAAGREGTVTGALSLNGAPVAISHVYASAQSDFFDKKAEDIRLLFSDVPLSDDDRTDFFALIHLGRDGKARILEVVVDKDGQVISGSIFAKEFDGQVSVTGMHKFERERFERATIAGRMYMDAPHEFRNVTFQYDLHFSAPIPRPMTAAERAAALASPPAHAAAAYVAAVHRGDLAAVRAGMTADAAAAFRGPDGAARLTDLHDDMPADAAVVELRPLTDGSILAKIEGHRDGIVIGYTLRMIETPDGWKVGEP